MQPYFTKVKVTNFFVTSSFKAIFFYLNTHQNRPRCVLSFVMLTKITANGFYKNRELALVIARMSHQIDHHACRFLPSIVPILKFRAADVCAKDGEKHRNKGFVGVF